MKNKMHIFFVTLVGFLSLLFCLSGCDVTPKTPLRTPVEFISSEVYLESTVNCGYETTKNFIAVCQTLEQLKSTCIDNGYDFFNDTGEPSNVHTLHNSQVGEKLRRLTEADFESKAFVVCGYYRPNNPGQDKIEGVNITGNQLTLYIDRPDGSLATDNINYEFLVAKVDKSLVATITSVDYVVRPLEVGA